MIIRRNCMGFYPVPDDIDEHRKEHPPKVDKNTPEPILDEILGLTTVCERILTAINKQKSNV